ncbi:UDP-glucosyltransferase 2-like [Aricia agestis]|uniref:UDP-glucosyltransferase 2-like n=1 Tax=Aricia agestis TaxID=91739 RepID=UPI001C2034EE|nr:UDP-glucosyltransferase 2-like [Aricia agestis]XP_041981576.1 UDP-glucosyltransferase 2-like [Aricia agestis]
MEVPWIFTIISLLVATDAYKILVVSPLPGKSHAILGDGIVNHLAKAGHQIHYITAIAPKKSDNVTVIEIKETYEYFNTFAEKFFGFEAVLEKKDGANNVLTIMATMREFSKITLNNPEVRTLLTDKNPHFDVIILEWLYSDVYAGLQAVFDCPFIWFSTIEPHWRILSLIDEIPNPAYTTDPMISSYPPFTFYQRVKELGAQIIGLLLEIFISRGKDIQQYQKMLVPIIEKKGKLAPSLDDLRYNASLVLGNSHISLGLPFKLPDNYKAIGGYHIEEDIQPLPKDLKKILDEASQGLIYFSMGSNLKSKTLPTKVKNDLLKMFGQLKQTVLWKFEDDLPNRPKNVHIVHWAPQQSILAHKNCILFITHGGLLSTTETVHFGIPIIGIPIFADQFINVDRAVQKGFAKRVDISYNVADDLKKAIDDILSDTAYRKKVKELSFIYHDRPVSPGKELVHWVEHVIRTNGAPHLRSPALMVPWYQKMYLDLATLVVVFILVIIYVIKKVIKTIKYKPDKKKKRN